MAQISECDRCKKLIRGDARMRMKIIAFGQNTTCHTGYEFCETCYEVILKTATTQPEAVSAERWAHGADSI